MFSFPVLLGALLAAAALVVTRGFKVDPDTWWHLVIGGQIMRLHAWPTAEVYSFTANGAAWVAHEWLGEVVFAAAARCGLTGLMALLFALAAGVVLLVYIHTQRCCRNAKAAFAATAAVLPLLGVWFTLHPQLLGYICLAVTLICLQCFRQGRTRALWFLPLVFLLWVNAHGTFTLGFLVLGAYWASGFMEFRLGNLVARRWPEGERRQFTAVLLASLLAGCITPYGPRLLVNPLAMMGWQQALTPDLTSWQPIPLEIWHGKLFVAYLLVFLVALVAGREDVKVEDAGLILVAATLTLLHARALPFFAIVFAPFLARLLAPYLPAYEPAHDRPVVNLLLVAALSWGTVKLFPSPADLQAAVASSFPAEAVEYLRGHAVPAEMFNDVGTGGYLLYTLGTGRRVFIDGRLEVYAPAGVWDDYLRLIAADPATPRLLGKYHINSCLVPAYTPLMALLASLPEWEKVYADGVGVIFVRRAADLGAAGREQKATN